MEKTLIKKDINNVIRIWSISVKESEICVSYGVKGGKMINKKQKIEKGKNIGKKNETTKEQQAILEAKSKINQKRDEGYCEEIKEIDVPMLAHNYSDHKSKLTFPCYIQPKLDGYRMTSRGGEMTTRNNKKYTVLYNTPLHKDIIKTGLTLDGELYVHDKNYAFENYGILRKKKLAKEDLDKISKIKYYVFDIIDKSSPFNERLKVLEKINSDWIVPVECHICLNEEEIETYHKKFIELGYEGSMLRNINSLYTNSRSYDLLKKKDFQDEEFEIIGFDYEKNLSNDNLKPIIWKCKTKEGKSFDVQSKGTRKERNELYNKAKEYIGRFITVKFFGFTEEGIPRFPKTLRSGKLIFQTI